MAYLANPLTARAPMHVPQRWIRPWVLQWQRHFSFNCPLS